MFGIFQSSSSGKRKSTSVLRPHLWHESLKQRRRTDWSQLFKCWVIHFKYIRYLVIQIKKTSSHDQPEALYCLYSNCSYKTSKSLKSLIIRRAESLFPWNCTREGKCGFWNAKCLIPLTNTLKVEHWVCWATVNPRLIGELHCLQSFNINPLGDTKLRTNTEYWRVREKKTPLYILLLY